MTAAPIVFAGPSLAGPVPTGCDLKPPAKAGDLLMLADCPPRTVALIDGIFDSAPAVQHKEILELLARGFRVVGAASMGALRAAELHRFGMIGVGSVFAAYASGRLVADDEVALLHAPPALGHWPLTDALVDMRATLCAAARAGVVAPAAARIIRRCAIDRFWQERTWPTVIEDCASLVDEAVLARLEVWLGSGRISIKARDARLCVRVALESWAPLRSDPPPRTAFFRALAGANGIEL